MKWLVSNLQWTLVYCRLICLWQRHFLGCYYSESKKSNPHFLLNDTTSAIVFKDSKASKIYQFTQSVIQCWHPIWMNSDVCFTDPVFLINRQGHECNPSRRKRYFTGFGNEFFPQSTSDNRILHFKLVLSFHMLRFFDLPLNLEILCLGSYAKRNSNMYTVKNSHENAKKIVTGRGMKTKEPLLSLWANHNTRSNF